MYQALYRQYRPKTFDEVLGQRHITVTLKNQIQKENIGHAYLFSGTRGTGKTSTAKIFSRAVNCLNPKAGNPCNECEICKGILDESIMDIIEMDAASNRGIGDIRELKDKVIYPPTRAKYKVYIIDEVHMLTAEAFNALLKILEEPPKHLIFILATTEPEKLLPTILSRCQRFDFKRITTVDILDSMRKICDDLGLEVEDKVLSLIARNSDGAMRDAQSLLDQCTSFSSGRITYEDATSILGMVNSDLILNMVENILDKDLEKVLQSINDIIQEGKDIHQFIKDLVHHFRNLMIMKTSKNPMELIEIDEDSYQRYLSQSKDISLNLILKALDILTTADEKSKWSTQPRIILEMAVIQLTKLDEEMSLEERVKKLEMGIKTEYKPSKEEPMRRESISKDRTTQTENEPKKEQTKEIPSEKEVFVDDGKELQLEMFVRDWESVLQIIKSKKMNIFALLIEGEPVNYEKDLLTIGYKEPFGFHKEAVSSPVNKEFVEQVFSAHFSKKINIKFEMISDKPKAKKDEKDDKEKAIKEVTDFFGKDIVEIK
ncbi:DNA polymerase III subunit gamma/tau [Tissierella sp.]|uniref:DNA polymerase III subunit gamma/tau n=1 Tax=Tissierella sp. TaxID=41274 RepID=UPI0028658E5F|nr:DNA polymerase III subunit gamma/tau [Tissierella sp.]MDR7857422.1 DNA polymerase III subunit gamma/tau [Tissierella sp.]